MISKIQVCNTGVLSNSKGFAKAFDRIFDVSIDHALQLTFRYAERLQGFECGSNSSCAGVYCLFDPCPHTFFDDLVGAKNLCEGKGV